jgi:hypothetical protein
MSTEGDPNAAPMEEDEAAAAATQEAESSGEESSGEESSGEEENGASSEASAPKPAVEEPEDDRLEGESKAARDKRVYQEEMRLARASRKEGAEAADAAQQLSNANIAREQVHRTLYRLPPLLPTVRLSDEPLPYPRARTRWRRNAWRS